MERIQRRAEGWVKLSLYRAPIEPQGLRVCPPDFHYSWKQRLQSLGLDWWLFSLYSKLTRCPCSQKNDPVEEGRGTVCPEDPKCVPSLSTRNQKTAREANRLDLNRLRLFY